MLLAHVVADHSKSMLYEYELTHILFLSSLCRERIALRIICSFILEKLSDRCGRLDLEIFCVVGDDFFEVVFDVVLFFEEFLACSSCSSNSKTFNMFSEYSLISAKSLASLWLVNLGDDSKSEKDLRNLTFSSVVFMFATFLSSAGVKSETLRANV